MKKVVLLVIMLLLVASCGSKEEPTRFNLLIYNANSKLVYDKNLETTKKSLLEALSGIKELRIVVEGNEVISIYEQARTDGRKWVYYVNEEKKTESVYDYKINPNDRITWRLEESAN